MLAVQEEHRLLQKKQTVEEGLTPAVTQPASKAKAPPKEVIWALEEGSSPSIPLDSFILGLVRFQVGCSARFNDLQHTAPTTMKHTSNTIEFAAWQYKTVSASKIRKHAVPLICPKFSFTGHAWWTPVDLVDETFCSLIV